MANIIDKGAKFFFYHPTEIEFSKKKKIIYIYFSKNNFLKRAYFFIVSIVGRLLSGVICRDKILAIF